MLDDLLDRNIAWSSRVRGENPDYFTRLATGQSPDFLWIGCSDSRVPANLVTDLGPGEIFVHRNVANVVHSSDMSLLCTLEFAVEALNIREIIVCGHYGCGGVRAACAEMSGGLADHWLEPIRRLARTHETDLAKLPAEQPRLDRLAELNVLDGVRRVCATPILRNAWKRGTDIAVHGLIYSLKDGALRNLNCTMRGPTPPNPG